MKKRTMKKETLGGIAYSKSRLYKLILKSDHFDKTNTINIYGWKVDFGGYSAKTSYTPLRTFLKANSCIVNELGDILYQSAFKIGVLR